MRAATADITPAAAATDVFSTADAPLPTAATIDVFPITLAAAVSHAEEPAAANILQRDGDEGGIVNAAADETSHFALPPPS